MNKIKGKYVNLREVELEDAEFILSLRCNAKKSKYLNQTENNIEKQREYLKKYKNQNKEYYFIIEDKKQNSIGTIRIYDIREDSFCPGSWILKDSISPEEALESDYLAKVFAFKITGANKFHFDVRKGNKKVLKFHKLMGAKIINENEIDYFFECQKNDYLNNIKKYLF